MHINLLLQRLGFSRNETRVYLAGLETGLASAQEIASVCGLKRTTVYSVLSYLVNRGVVAKTKVKGRGRFITEPPQRLLSLINELEKGIKEAMPELAAIYNKQETKPKIIFYEGDSAIQKVYDDTLEQKPAEILEYNTNAYFEGKTQVDPDYIHKRVALGIKAKRIASKGSKWDAKHKYLDEKELAQTLIVSAQNFNPQIEINIYNNKVAFLNYAEKMSVIIESKAIAEAMRQAYELSWRGAKGLEN